METSIVVNLVNAAVNTGESISTAQEAVAAILKKRYMPRSPWESAIAPLVQASDFGKDIALAFLGNSPLRAGLREAVKRGNYAALEGILDTMVSAGETNQTAADAIKNHFGTFALSIAEQFGRSYKKDLTGITADDVTNAVPTLS